jgi:hypothetical protein
MEENKKILLPNKRYKKADDQELNLELGLETSESLLRIGDKDIILDLAKLYVDERNASPNYKIFGKLKMVFRNMYSGTTEYSYLKERLYLVGDGTENNDFPGFLPYDEFAFLRKDVYREVNVPTTKSTLGTFTPNITYSGSTAHQEVTPINAPYHNWNLYLTYIDNNDSNFQMKYTLSGNTYSTLVFNSGDGIPFRIEDNGNMYTFTSPVPHGMKEGEYVRLSGDQLPYAGNSSDNTFYITSVGNEIYDSENYVINILKTEIKDQYKTSYFTSTIFLGKRVLDINNIDDTISEYYVHKHRTLTDTGGYIMDQIGFETPIFEDEKKILVENSAGKNDVIVERNRMESVLYDFKEPLVLSGLTNNLGYTPTEVYVTTIFRNGNGYFDYPPKIGYKFNFHNSWIDEHFDGSSSNETNISSSTFTREGITFTSGNTIPIGTTLTGAYVEYNKKELKERIISEAYHKFTNPTSIFDFNQDTPSVYDKSSATNMFGLYYQPHNRVKLRELSPYTESAKTNDILNLPENTIYDSTDDVWRWRDLYDHGYVDIDGYGTDFPFVNNIHYVKKDINFYLRNEKNYNNKQDGLIDFNKRKIDC